MVEAVSEEDLDAKWFCIFGKKKNKFWRLWNKTE